MSKNFSVDVEKRKCVTPECRFSYVNILEKGSLPNSDDEAYSAQLIFKKTPEVEEFLKALQKVYAQAMVSKFGVEKAKKLWPVVKANKRFPVRDGDDPANGHLANAEQLKGCYFINSKNVFRQPHIIGPMGKAVDPNTLTPDDIYSGMWGRAMLEFFGYDTAGNKGVGTSLAAVMKTKDDENLGGGVTKGEAEGGFEDFADEATDMMSMDDEPVDSPKDDTEGFDFM